MPILLASMYPNYSTMSLELKTKDQDAALVVINLNFGIKAKGWRNLYTQKITFLIAIYHMQRTVYREILPF